MLSKEQAEQAIKASALEDGPARLVARVIKLTEPVKTLALGIMGLDAAGNAVLHDWQKISRARTDLARLEPAQQDALIDAWFPSFAPLARVALRRSRPYLNPYQSRPFRLRETDSAAHLDESGIQWLERLRHLTQHRDQPLRWYAEHAAYLGWGADALAPLFAAAIDAGDDELLKILIASGKNEHPIGMMGDHVTKGLLMASRSEGWGFVEKLLLAARRQEGLRQSIYLAMFEAHPAAFKRLLRVILEHDLIRFSSSVQALQNMMGWEGIEATPKQLRDALETLVERLEDIPGCERDATDTNSEPDPLSLFQWLWCIATEDAPRAATLAGPWLTHPNATLRFTVTAFFVCLSNPALTAPQLRTALEDEDLHVVARAFSSHGWNADGDAFEAFEGLLQRVPDEINLPSPVPWLAGVTLSPKGITQAMFQVLGDRDPKRLLGHWKNLQSYTRSSVLDKLAERNPWDPQTRATILESVGDAGEYVRRSAFNALEKQKFELEPRELTALEELLTRKRSDMRQGVIKLLLRQPREVVQGSAKRLSNAKNADQRAASEELLKLLETEDGQANAPTLRDGLGLFDPEKLTKPRVPKPQKVKLVTPAALECLRSLDALIDSHAQTPVKFKNWANEEQEAPLVNARVNWPDMSKALDEDTQPLPLREVWETWYANRPKNQRDTDGFELLRAASLVPVLGPQRYSWQTEYRPKIVQDVLDELSGTKTNLLLKLIGKNKRTEFKQPHYVRVVLAWLNASHAPDSAMDFLLDAAEHSLSKLFPTLEVLHREALISKEEPKKSNLLNSISHSGMDIVSMDEFEGLLERIDESDHTESTSMKNRQFLAQWSSDERLSAWLTSANPFIRTATEARAARLWYLQHAVNNTPGRSARGFSSLELTLQTWRLGEIGDADVLDQLIGPRNLDLGTVDNGRFSELNALTARKPDALLETFPELKPLVDRVRNRIIEVERSRGDLPTAASKPALSIRYAQGSSTLVSLLTGLGKAEFVRGYISQSNASARGDTISHLIRVSFPAPDDTPEYFVRLVRDARISEKRLVELGLYAPQWSRFVEHALGWTGVAEAMWWLHAHTKDRGWHVQGEVLESWQSEISEQTPLSAQDLLDGAVDVAWFNRVHAQLGADRWAKVYEAAKFASGGAGHTRAKQFADAMLGHLEQSEVIERIRSKRHQDSMRALGLIPLPNSSSQDEIEAAVLQRFEVIQEFLRGTKAFGSQRRESESLAARIGMVNLANTAGFPDPLRLTWAMELKSIADLADGPVMLERDGTRFALSITSEGKPEFSVEKNGKPLKTVPAGLKKDEDVLELQERRRQLERQSSRMRASLERAMVHGDSFSTKELRSLWTHPLLRAMFEKLVFVTDSGRLGYLTSRGQALRDHAQLETKLSAKARLRIAHPHDLLRTNAWSAWQQECFGENRVQPFKQVFRELYVLTDTERAGAIFSSRYAGHQVNPKQSMALLGQRGWVSRMEEGLSKTFHDEGITAWLESNRGWTTPAELEAPTLEGLFFTKKGDWKRLPLTEIPPRLLSEVMRDVDLIVSVAHVGGVDPEASASTVEMRAAMVRETSALLKLANVTIKDSHVLVQGKLNRYTIHLGSGTVHQQPGGYLCIVAVPSQHRGRVFLPFADNDPRTAEVVSKVLLLARDEQIQDPGILHQIVA